MARAAYNGLVPNDSTPVTGPINSTHIFCGLRLLPRAYLPAWKAIGVSIIIVTITIALCDVVLFRKILPARYVAFFGGPGLVWRILVCMALSIKEEIFYRLAAMSVLVIAFGFLRRDRTKALPFAVILVAAFIAQAINIALHVPMPSSVAEFAYDGIRYLSPGLVWGWLYWRHGLASSMIAHAGTHVVLQPILFVALRP